MIDLMFSLNREPSNSSRVNIRLLVFILFVSSVGNCFAQTQSELNQEAADAFKKSDAELNTTYQIILKNYADDAGFISAMKTSQRNWITFRDSELKMKFPDREHGWYGSVHPMCVSYFMAQMTQERTEVLKQWVQGVEEGDVCAGSSKIHFEEVKSNLLERIDDFNLVRLLNELTFLNSYQTEELSIKIMSSSNLPGSAGFANGEATTNIWIAVSEFGEIPEQALYRVNNLFAPKINSFDKSNASHPVITISHLTAEEFDEMFFRISIDKIEQL